MQLNLFFFPGTAKAARKLSKVMTAVRCSPAPKYFSQHGSVVGTTQCFCDRVIFQNHELVTPGEELSTDGMRVLCIVPRLLCGVVFLCSELLVHSSLKTIDVTVSKLTQSGTLIC